MSDGIYLGLHAEVSARSTCAFCRLIIYALEEGADIGMINEYDDWPAQEVWLRNHALSQSGKVVNFVDKEDEHVVRLDIWLSKKREENIMFSSGGPEGRTVTIQEVQVNPLSSEVQSYEGRAVDNDTKGLVETIQRWTRPCLEGEAASTDAHSRSSARVRLIDTVHECIVGPTHHERYVALRYAATHLLHLALTD